MPRDQRLNANQQRWREKTKERQKEYHRKYEATPEGRAKLLLRQAKTRAKRAGLPFNLDLVDVVVPAACPVLGIPIDCGPKERRWGSPNSPSLDRRDPALGYVKGNVTVMSWRANSLKKDATAVELRKLADYLSQES